MYEKLRKIIFTWIIATILTASAEAPEISPNANALNSIDRENEVYYAESEREEEAEECLSVSESVTADSFCVIAVDEELIRELEESLTSVNTMLDQITSIYSEENVETEAQVARQLEEIREVIEQQPTSLTEVQEQYNTAKERLECYTQMLQSIQNKLETIKISSNTDMSQIFGFTEEEFIYILKNVRGKKGNLIIKDSEMAEKVAKGVIEAVTEYPVNELFAVSVMSFESGYFTSTLVVKYNNFGGMKKTADEAYHFETPEEGILAAVKCIHSNLRKNNTANDVNEKYCSPHITYDEEENEIVDVYYWARNVVSIAKSYARGIAKFS